MTAWRIVLHKFWKNMQQLNQDIYSKNLGAEVFIVYFILVYSFFIHVHRVPMSLELIMVMGMHTEHPSVGMLSPSHPTCMCIEQ